MEATWLYESIYNVSHYAPLVICVAALLDIFFVTGLLLYGIAMLSTVGMMHMSGMITTPELLVSAWVGTITGNVINYWTGRLFGKTIFVQKRLNDQRLHRVQEFLHTRGLVLFMILGRFITVTRPLYALLIGSVKIRFRRFIAVEIPLALFWVTFWLLILHQGEAVYLRAIS